ncbi:hypothetical protein V2G26_013999 [Clonostachys chloroleuca]
MALFLPLLAIPTSLDLPSPPRFIFRAALVVECCTSLAGWSATQSAGKQAPGGSTQVDHPRHRTYRITIVANNKAVHQACHQLLQLHCFLSSCLTGPVPQLPSRHHPSRPRSQSEILARTLQARYLANSLTLPVNLHILLFFPPRFIHTCYLPTDHTKRSPLLHFAPRQDGPTHAAYQHSVAGNSLG